MQGQTVALILAAVVFSAMGQILLKSGVLELAGHQGLGFLLAAAREVRVLAGLSSWIASTLCWLYVLRVAPLSRAYMLSSLTYVLVPFAGIHLFGEQVRRVHFAGMVLIVIGVALLLHGD